MKRHFALIALAVLSVPSVAEATPDCMTFAEARAAHPNNHLWQSHGCWSDHRRTTAQKPAEQRQATPPVRTEASKLPPERPAPPASSQPVPPQSQQAQVPTSPQPQAPASPQPQVLASPEPQVLASPPNNPPSNLINPTTVQPLPTPPAQLRADVFQPLLGGQTLAHGLPLGPPSSFEQRWETPREPVPKEKEDAAAKLTDAMAPVPASQVITIDKARGIGLVAVTILVGLGLIRWISALIRGRTTDRLAGVRHWLTSRIRSDAPEPDCEPLHETFNVRLIDDREIRRSLEEFTRHHFARGAS